jgi:hypothetical protein
MAPEKPTTRAEKNVGIIWDSILPSYEFHGVDRPDYIMPAWGRISSRKSGTGAKPGGGFVTNKRFSGAE